MARKNTKSLKKKAWTLFSQYIRTRDCLATTGDVNYGVCCTCGRTYEYKQLQAGHFISGRHNSILFDQHNCHAQCYSCNMHLNGNGVMYYKFMLKMYSQEEIDRLIEQDRVLKSFDAEELENLITTLKKTIDNLRY